MLETKKQKIFLLIILLIILIPLIYYEVQNSFQNFFERERPLIKIEKIGKGVSKTPLKLKLILEDKDSGLDQVVIRVFQKNRKKEVFKKNLFAIKRKKLNVEIPLLDDFLIPGKAEIQVRVFDKSFWNNSEEYLYELDVDYRMPEIDPITSQHNAYKGGSQLVAFQAWDKNLLDTGIEVEGFSHRAFSGKLLDPNFKSSLYFSLYGVPLKDISSSDIRIYAEDSSGNLTYKEFYNKILNKNYKKLIKSIPNSFFKKNLEQLSFEYENFLKENLHLDLPPFNAEAFLGSPSKEEQFKLISNIFPLVLDRIIQTNLEKHPLSVSKLFYKFTSPFISPGKSITANFYQQIDYYLNGEKLISSPSLAYKFLAPNMVKSVADGLVIFSKTMPFYKKILAIHHGGGLITIYGNLADIKISTGSIVQQGDIIGEADYSVFNKAKELYFETRIGHIRTNPGEWFDKEWIKDHIIDKILDTKTLMGLEAKL